METLVFIAGLQQGQRFVVDKDLVRLGRERFNDLTIDDEAASRAHAEIRRHGDVLRLRDLGSTNGTYVNSRRASEVVLSDGDRISVGGTVMLLEAKGEQKDTGRHSVLFSEGDPADVTTQFRLDPSGKDFLSPARMRVDVRSQENFKRLYSFMIRTAGLLTVSKLLESAMDEIFNATGADRGFILLADEDGSRRPTNLRRREDRAVVKAAEEITVSKTLSRHVLEKGESLMLTEVQKDERFADSTAFGTGSIVSVVAAPLKKHDKFSGLVYLDTLQGGRTFNQTDQELVTAMSLVTAAMLENVRLYEQIMSATEFSAAILRSLSSGLMVVDNDLTVRKVNRAALNLLGVEEMDVSGRSMTELPGTAEIADAVRKALEEKRPVDRGEVELRAGQTNTPVGLSISFLTDPRGNIQGAVANFRDLSQVKRLAEQIKRQEHLASLGEMAAGVAHEIRNPLNSIRGFAQLLGERAGPPKEAPADEKPPQDLEYLNIIVEEVDRMNGIVQDLLDFARQRQITMSPLSVEEVLRSVLKQVAQEAEALDMEVVDDISADLPRTYGNSDKLRQVFMNVCRNALQAMSAGGKLTVRARLVTPGRDDGPKELAIEFEDTGTGIPESAITKVFDPFFTTKDVGTGLGLAICAKIAEAHSGRLEVESPPGKGATFTVFLPAPARNKTDRFPPVQ
ncbi:MAG: ATP-binding protein [Planctomycetota bacterium]